MFTKIFSGNNYDYFEMTAYIHIMLILNISDFCELELD